MPDTKNNILRILLKTLVTFVLLLCFILSIFYIATTIYDFPEAKPFTGNKIYNPYQILPDSLFRANFHAHSKAWKGVTNGRNTEKDVFDAYTDHGYDIAAISNYHAISAYAKAHTDLYFPGYEHGFNILKSHYLVINAQEVSFLDFPLWQSTSHQQKVLDNIKQKNNTVAIAHPKFGGGRNFENMHQLVHYDFTEVLNHYRVSDDYWDHGLSSGRLSWVLGNDDIHDVADDPIFRMWNMIYAPARDVNVIVENMKAGRHYAVQSYNGDTENNLVSCQLIDSTSVAVKFERQADSIQFIGQNGNIKHMVSNTDTASYTFDKSDTYIRLVAHHPNSKIFLNPLVRYDGNRVPLCSEMTAPVHHLKTWLCRMAFIFLSMSIIYLIRKVIRY